MQILKSVEGKYGEFMRIIFPFFILLLFFIAEPFAWAKNEPYLAELLQEADRKKLHGDPYWHILLHYKSRLNGGVESLVDDPDFFLATEGKYDPEAELRATVAAFFEPEFADRKHPACRFIARFSWLAEKLSIDTRKLPVSECPDFEKLIEEMQPESDRKSTRLNSSHYS